MSHSDEKYYKMVLEELQQGSPNQALWLKALTLSNGDEAAAKLQYVRWRVDELMKDDKQAQLDSTRDRLASSFQAQTPGGLIMIILVVVVAVLAFALIKFVCR